MWGERGVNAPDPASSVIEPWTTLNSNRINARERMFVSYVFKISYEIPIGFKPFHASIEQRNKLMFHQNLCIRLLAMSEWNHIENRPLKSRFWAAEIVFPKVVWKFQVGWTYRAKVIVERLFVCFWNLVNLYAQNYKNWEWHNNWVVCYLSGCKHSGYIV